jgi:protein TonB
MSELLEGDERLEGELTQEPVYGSAALSLLLHGAMAALLVLYGIVGGLMHPNLWGHQEAGGAIQVTLVSSSLPLPADRPPNDNVLATETPSQAPAPPAPKAKEAVDQTAIPISGKEKPKQPQAAPKTPQSKNQPKPDNRAQYGEQASSSMPRATKPQVSSSGPVTVNDGDFGSRFGWYVDGINRKMATTWYKTDVAATTPQGTRVYLVFTIHKDGNPSDVLVDRASGSPSLDRSCVRGVQRVDSFGKLPPSYNQSTLKVSYYCEY